MLGAPRSDTLPAIAHPCSFAVFIFWHAWVSTVWVHAVSSAMPSWADEGLTCSLFSCRLALQELNRALRGPKAQQQSQQRQLQKVHHPACRLQPGYQHHGSLADRAALNAKVRSLLHPTVPSSVNSLVLTQAAVYVHASWYAATAWHARWTFQGRGLRCASESAQY